MSGLLTCPDREVLRRWMLDQLPDLEAGVLARHLEGCGRCSQAVEGLKKESPPTEALLNQEVIPPAVERTNATEVGYTFLAPPQRSDELGRLGPYRVLRVLGAGGMGVVFEAEDPHLDRRVALKAMLPTRAASPETRQRFLREARAAAAVEHDHIVHINQVGEDHGVPYLAMPLLKGESLDDRMKRPGRLPISEVLRVGREIAEGLGAAHERGLIHRDIKPANVWLEGSRSRVKILDFGLARAAADRATLTQAGAIVGTPAYMAPEQARSGSIDARADLFSLGCVLYRLATGEMPFRGADTLAVLASLSLDDPPPPCRVQPEVPPALSDLIMHLLAKNPQDRPPSARAVIEAIRAIEAGNVPSTTLPPGLPLPRRRRILTGLAFLVAALTATGVYLIHINTGQKADIDPDEPKERVGKDTSPPPVNPAAVNRKAPEAILVLGGGVGVTPLRGGTPGELLREKASLPAEAFSIHSIDLSRFHFPAVRELKDDDLDFLRGLEGLEALDLESHAIQGRGFRFLEASTKLRWISLSHSRVTDTALEHLSRHKGLQVLALNGTQVSNFASPSRRRTSFGISTAGFMAERVHASRVVSRGRVKGRP